jgi:hypothetical protein
LRGDILLAGKAVSKFRQKKPDQKGPASLTGRFYVWGDVRNHMRWSILQGVAP